MTMYGSDSLRKYTAPWYAIEVQLDGERSQALRRATAWMNSGSPDRLAPLPAVSIARRETRSCSLPSASMWISSVIGGT